jgi:hypothetical protein
MEKAANELPIEQVAKRWIVASDPDEAVAKVKDYVGWGLNHLVFHAPDHDQRRFLELFQKDLEPLTAGLTRSGTRRSELTPPFRFTSAPRARPGSSHASWPASVMSSAPLVSGQLQPH